MNTPQNTFGMFFFIKKNRKDKQGKAPIYVRITLNGKRSDMALKHNLSEINWNSKRGIAKGTKPEIVKLNNYL
jgi:hypothetical protein